MKGIHVNFDVDSMASSRPYSREFHGKVALVTGAASGIGLATCRQLHQQGAEVIGLDLNEPGNLETVPWTTVQVDVSDPVAVSSQIGEVARRFGPVDLLVHAAGILVEGQLLAESFDWTLARQAYAVHVEGLLAVVRAVAPEMVRRRAGAIVTVASNAGLTPRLNLGSYGATKAATIMLARCLGLELADAGVRCNVVSPGSTETPMLAKLLRGRPSVSLIQGNLAQHRLGIPLKRLAKDDEIADVILFLLSERARHITMENVRVDGGATL